MMTRKHFPPLITSAAVCFVLFWIAAAFTGSTQLTEIIRAIQIPISIAVVVAYSPDSWRALWAENPNGVLQLCLGVTCNWVGSIGAAAWVLLFRMADQPLWMLHADLPNMFATLSVFGACLHITAPGSIYGSPKRSMVYLGLGLGALTLVLLGLISLHPDLRGVTDRMRPYLEDHKAGLIQPWREGRDDFRTVGI